MKNIILCFILFCFLIDGFHCEQNKKYAKNMPYIPENFFENYVDNYLIRIWYNYHMHNYDEVIIYFEQNKKILEKELELYSLDKGNYTFSHIDEWLTYTNWLSDYIEIQYILGNTDIIISEFKFLIEMNECTDDGRYFVDMYETVMLYYLFKMNLIDDFNTMLKGKDLFDMAQTYIDSSFSFFTSLEITKIKYLAKLSHEYLKNTKLALGLLDHILEGTCSIRTAYLKSEIFAEKNTFEAIRLLENELSYFFSDEYDNPMTSYIQNIERTRMKLAYLHYKVGNIDKALLNFELAVTKIEQGSTFLGDWDYWFDLRYYYNDELEVLKKLKKLYLERKKAKDR